MRYTELVKPCVAWCLVATLTLPALPALGAEASGQPKPQKFNWSAGGFTEAQKKFWSFQPIKDYTPPEAKNKKWIRTPIDAFIAAKMEAQGVAPAPEADRSILIHRATLDVTGLPPTPEEVDAFVNDKSPQAYEKLVDRLLGSQAFGEHWAHYWLDIARYGDSDGFIQDGKRPNAWRYRDYVVKAINDDKPYDRFLKEQIAGDELWPDDQNAFIATGFLRGYQDEYNARDIGLRRQEILNDITDTTGAAVMGLTFGCARCHDHKFDAIRQEDYYQLQSFFSNSIPKDDHTLLTGSDLTAYQEKKAAWEAATKATRDQIETLVAPLREKAYTQRLTGFVPDDRTAITKPDSERTPLEKWIVARYRWREKGFQGAAIAKLKKVNVGDDAIVDDNKDPAAAKKLADDREKFNDLQSELKKFADLDPGPMPVAYGMTEQTDVAPATYILKGGTYGFKGKEVQPGFLGVLGQPAPAIVKNETLNSTGRRTALANWFVDPSNPLPARVIVNRLWAGHFGRGIVGSPSDFGVMGERPTHPELLDYLATQLVKNNWSLKSIHRMILLSSTYRQSSNPPSETEQKDPRNLLFASYPWQRMDAQEVRDAMLLTAGLLVKDKVGGPAFQPPLPKSVQDGGREKVAQEKDPDVYNRRSIYIAIRRNAPDPMLDVFDTPPSFDPCPQRSVSTTAPQALTLFNSDTSLQWSEALAGRVLREAGNNPNEQISRLFKIVYSRQPDGTEKDNSQTFLFRQKELIAKRLAAGEKVALPSGLPETADKASAAAFVDLSLALLNSNEFIYRF